MANAVNFKAALPALTNSSTTASNGAPPVFRASRSLSNREATFGSLRQPRFGSASPQSLPHSHHLGRVFAVQARYDDEDIAVQNLSFFERLVKAWKILFPEKARSLSDADIARERLRLVLYSDRSELANDVKTGLRQRIIEAISSYVEIESEDDVQLNVSADADLGTVYSITIPVRRVRPEFQGYWSEVGFRDRFYEELLRNQGITEKFTRIELRRDFDREREAGM